MRNLETIMLIVALGCTCALAEEWQINSYVSQDQKDVDLAFNGDGLGIAVWNSYQQDGSSGGIFAQLLSDTVEFPGDEFPVNAQTEGNQVDPAAAMSADGRFLLCWCGPGLEPDNDDIFIRLFDSNAVPEANDIVINEFTDNGQRNPRASALAEGYVIVWESKGFLGDTNRQICARILDPNAQAVGPEIRISDAVTDCRNPDIATDTQGRILVTWLEGKSSYHVKARTFDANGIAEGPSFRVDTVSPRSVTSPSIAMHNQGDFIIAWDGDPNRAADDDIHLRQYDLNGLALGDQVMVNTSRLGAQRNPRITLNAHGIGLVVWEHESSSDANSINIMGQYFDPNGYPLGPELQFNTIIEDKQQDPALHLFPSGQAVIAWESDEQDGSGRGVFGTLSPPCLAADMTSDEIVNFLDFCVLAEDNAALPGASLDPNDLTSLCEKWANLVEPVEERQ
jgi:hypothetical protein